MKSSGAPVPPLAELRPRSQCSRNWRRNAAAFAPDGPVLAGPPTFADGSARFTAAAAKSYSLSYSSVVPCQYEISGSFQTSQYQDSTCSFPYFSTLGFTTWKTSSPHFPKSLAGKTHPMGKSG